MGTDILTSRYQQSMKADATAFHSSHPAPDVWKLIFLLFPYEISEIYICQNFSPKIMNVNHMVALQGRSRNTRICGIRPLGNKHINFMATHPKVVRPEWQDDTTGWIVPGEKHGCTSNPDMQSAADPELIRYSCSWCSILKSVPK